MYGKSTVFNAITQAGAESSNYPFCTIEPNIGIVNVPDYRVDNLSKLYDSIKKTYANVEFVDIAGLVKGASKGEGLGNKFLSNIRQTDAIVHVVRCFENENIIHVSGVIDPIDDIETIELELILADTDTIISRIEKVKKQTKSGDKLEIHRLEVLNKILENLKNLISVKNMNLTIEEQELIYDTYLLTNKPVIYVANISENQLNIDTDPNVEKVKEYANKNNCEVITLCAKLEEELSSLDKEDKLELMNEYNIKESGLDKLIKTSYSTLRINVIFNCRKR